MLSIIESLTDIANRLGNTLNWVTAEYDSDGWHVIKYRNGWCKLYYRRAFTAENSGWSAWGNVYTKLIDPIKYPVTFESTPFQSAELQTSSRSGWLNIGWNTVSDTGKCELIRGSAGTSFNAWIVYRVYGKLSGGTA